MAPPMEPKVPRALRACGAIGAKGHKLLTVVGYVNGRRGGNPPPSLAAGSPLHAAWLAAGQGASAAENPALRGPGRPKMRQSGAGHCDACGREPRATVMCAILTLCSRENHGVENHSVPDLVGLARPWKIPLKSPTPPAG
eukprot:gene12932-biopygen19989